MQPANLPVRLTSLLGREQDSTALCQILRRPDSRLLTITGIGGVGKTSLALEVAQELQDEFTQGTHFVSLAAISDPTLVIPTLARAVSLSESPNRLLFDSLKDHLREKKILLLLDNFEQLLSAAPLLSELLSATEKLKLLVTSREALGLRGEQEFPLAPLKFSGDLQIPERQRLETLLGYSGIALFVRCAQASQPDFQLTMQNAASVSEICARLDGLPLAIELAAARIKLLTPHALLSRLQESSLSLLTRGGRDLPVRQQTLRGAIQWSFDLLNAADQRAFCWLSVFVGGCTLEAAIAVIGGQAALDTFDSLVNKSLVRPSEKNGESRLNMLETLREFGLEQLAQTRELEASRRAHADYYLSFAETAEPHLIAAEQKEWLERLDHDQDNLRAALHWGIENHEVEFAQRIAGALRSFWFVRGYWSEGRRWLEESLSLNVDGIVPANVRAKALYGAGMLARYQGDFARARNLDEQSVALYRSLRDNVGLLSALLQTLFVRNFQKEREGFEELMNEAMTLASSLPESSIKAGVLVELVVIMSNLDRERLLPKATDFLAESERIYRSLHHQPGLAFVLLWQGIIAVATNEFERADACFDVSEQLARNIGDHRTLSRVVLNRLSLDMLRHDHTAARRRIEESLRGAEVRGDYQLPYMLVGLASALHQQGLQNWAARVFGMADAQAGTRERLLDLAVFEERYGINRERAAVRSSLGEKTFAKEMAAGRYLTLDDLSKISHPPGDAGATAGLVEPLTAREMEVLQLLAQDLSNPQIAEKLGVSRRTVDAHLQSVYGKLGVKSREIGGSSRAAGWVVGNRGSADEIGKQNR